ncbi:MAG: hypothetical protein K6B72_05620 [Lachnospiraceae bacterium]|nr:hypothetical protein [Lachnospiraceae bacterium]
MFEYEKLKEDYEGFQSPRVQVLVAGKNVATDKKQQFSISNIQIDLTCGFEASVAEFVIYNSYNELKREYMFKELKPYITIGSAVSISIGYGPNVREVFRGFISEVNFVFRRGEAPGVEVHAMDFKGIMMANNYAKQIKAECYSEAVKEILEQAFYQKLKGDTGVFNNITIADTPDKPKQGGKKETTDKTIEMVCESDYEFVVKAAKKYNYEFFQAGDTIHFRQAKCDTQTLMNVGPETGLMAFEIGYNMTGLAGKIEVRNTDPGKGQIVKYAIKNKGKLSQGSIAKQLVDKQTRVYIDPTASSQIEAENRARYLLEDMSYRLGTLEADFIGLPELTPGKFIEVTGFGTPVKNKFYIYSVHHSMEANKLFETHVTGKASTQV